MRKCFVVAGLLLFAPVLRTQEHAPTVEACRADNALWHSAQEEADYLNQEMKHIDDGSTNKNPVAKLPLKEIYLRMGELNKCFSVDERNSSRYFDTHRFYETVVTNRYFSFIVRHHLRSQFEAEDAAGAR